MDEAENQITDLEHKEDNNNQSEQQEKRIQNSEDSISILWDNFKMSNIRIQYKLGHPLQQRVLSFLKKLK